MSFLGWYAAMSACIGTPLAILLSLNGFKNRPPEWVMTGAMVTAVACWILGMAYILDTT